MLSRQQLQKNAFVYFAHIFSRVTEAYMAIYAFASLPTVPALSQSLRKALACAGWSMGTMWPAPKTLRNCC